MKNWNNIAEGLLANCEELYMSLTNGKLSSDLDNMFKGNRDLVAILQDVAKGTSYAEFKKFISSQQLLPSVMSASDSDNLVAGRATYMTKAVIDKMALDGPICCTYNTGGNATIAAVSVVNGSNVAIKKAR